MHWTSVARIKRNRELQKASSRALPPALDGTEPPDTDVPVDDPLPSAVSPQCPGIEHRVTDCDVDEWLPEALSMACAPTQSISLPSTPVCLRMCAFWLHPSGVCVDQCHEI